MKTDLPKQFEGDAFRHFREVQRQQAEQMRQAEMRQDQEMLNTARAIVAEPHSSQDEKDWANQLLAEREGN